MFWTSVAAGITANALFAALTIGVGLLLLLGRRKALLRFWGLAESRTIRIFVSHLRIPPAGAADAAGNRRSFQGSAVALLEASAASALQSLFAAPIPGLRVQPHWAAGLFFVNAEASVEASPLTSPSDLLGTIVSLGSPAYNEISRRLESESPDVPRFVGDNTAIQLPGQLLLKKPSQAVVVRFSSAQQTWFYAAGISEPATAAAAYYLARSWRRLDRAFRDTPSFYVALEMTGYDLRSTRVVAEAAL